VPKGIHDHRYRALIDRLVAARKAAGLSQAALAGKLGKPQQFVSRFELGERRLDVMEYVDVAAIVGLEPLATIAEALSA
jgi:transcriptional regulator with XRE-family HTH domain